jgi:hypothetical protein
MHSRRTHDGNKVVRWADLFVPVVAPGPSLSNRANGIEDTVKLPTNFCGALWRAGSWFLQGGPRRGPLVGQQEKQVATAPAPLWGAAPLIPIPSPCMARHRDG